MQLFIHDPLTPRKSPPFVLHLFVHTFTILLLQCSLLLDLLVRLDLIVDLQVLEVFETDTTFGALAHFHDILLDVLERVDFSWNYVSIKNHENKIDRAVDDGNGMKGADLPS